MSRFLEAVFVIGCSLVGFGMTLDRRPDRAERGAIQRAAGQQPNLA